MSIRVDGLKFKKIDYDKVLDGSAMVMYKRHDNDRTVVHDLRDRKKMCNNNYPWYKGSFGNALIALQYAKTTNKLYLISYSALGNFSYFKKTTIEMLEKYAAHTIEREED